MEKTENMSKSVLEKPRKQQLSVSIGLSIGGFLGLLIVAFVELTNGPKAGAAVVAAGSAIMITSGGFFVFGCRISAIEDRVKRLEENRKQNEVIGNQKTKPES